MAKIQMGLARRRHPRVLGTHHNGIKFKGHAESFNNPPQTFGLEITRLDMKLFADMVQKKAYRAEELKA